MSEQLTVIEKRLAEDLGMSLSVCSDFSRLLNEFDVHAMHAEEQAIFLLEFGRLARDRYEQLSASAQGIIPTLTESVTRLINELIAQRR